MNIKQLEVTARQMVADDKGLLAIDESTTTCDKRFANLGIPQTEEARRSYRELLITTPGLGESVSGLILYDETIRQSKTDGTPFLKIIMDAGIIAGIKVDTGAKPLAAHPLEKITEGLDSLRDRLKQYSAMGLRFAKWRAVIAIGHEIPSSGCIEANTQALARYAALCQEAGLVPVVEPEVLMDGDHSLERCRQVTSDVLKSVFEQLYAQKVMLEGMILGDAALIIPEHFGRDIARGLDAPVQLLVDASDANTANLSRATRPGNLCSRAIDVSGAARPSLSNWKDCPSA